MLEALAPTQRELVLDFFATDAEAEVRTEGGLLDREGAELVARAGVLATEVWQTVSHDNPAALYANTVIGWAGLKLLTPDYWRFGRGLVQRAIAEAGDFLRDEQRLALEIAPLARFETAGDGLGDFDLARPKPIRHLILSRDEGDEEDWPLLRLTYDLERPATDEPSAIALATCALEEMPSLAYGKLFLAADGRLLYQLELLEDPSRELLPDALRKVSWVAIREGRRFAEQLHGAAS